MEEKKIEVVKTWPKPKSMRDIQVFIGFTNFYWCFINCFSKIAAPLTSIVKTTLLDILLTSGSPGNVNPIASDVKGIGGTGSIKAKNIKKLTKSKKPDFAKSK